MPRCSCFLKDKNSKFIYRSTLVNNKFQVISRTHKFINSMMTLKEKIIEIKTSFSIKLKPWKHKKYVQEEKEEEKLL